ncbi:MAG TPA: hypothetical protein VGQ21_00585 [Thermoanaerobaculia bacterium]|jgi:hypothetical protein|nr:hypothetical protein [Thermoanaerobaculia bacterium]
MNTRAQLIDVLFVIVPHSLLLDVAGPAEAFRLANQHREARGLPPRFRLAFSGPVENLPTSVGLTLGDLIPLPEQFTTPTWVVVVGQPTANVTHPTPEIAVTARWLRDRLHGALLEADTPHRLVTICSARSSPRAPVSSARAAAPRTTSCCTCFAISRRRQRSSTIASSSSTVRSHPARASQRGSTSRCI